MSNVFEQWTCIFPGKMGLSWKRAWDGVGTKEQAETEAAKNCNVVAVPLQLFEKMKEHERRMVKAERMNEELGDKCRLIGEYKQMVDILLEHDSDRATLAQRIVALEAELNADKRTGRDSARGGVEQVQETRIDYRTGPEEVRQETGT